MDYIRLKEESLNVTKTPFPGYNLINMVGILAQNKYAVGIRYIPRLIYSLSLGIIMAPFRIKEKILFDKKIEQTEINQDPIFIIGHWRSGTTYLHYVLALDKNLGFFDTFQAYVPGVFLGSEKLFKPIVESSVPEKRPMDDVAMSANLPQEDQYALGALTPYSYYHGWCFPKNMEFYNKYVIFDDVKKEETDAWEKAYVHLLKKITLYENGKQLVLKNQDNTTKIQYLLKRFPNAKFILMIRNPYNIYYSMMKFMRIVIPLYCLQNPPSIEILEESMMNLYEKLHKKYLNEKHLIPKGNLIEVKYEEFIQDPMNQLKRIYKELSINGFSENKETFKQFFEQQKEIKLDNYTITPDVLEKINKKWDFIFNAFNYEKKTNAG